MSTAVLDPVQQRRLDDSARFLERWRRPVALTACTRGYVTPAAPLPQLKLVEAPVTAAERKHLLDPLGLARARHDVEVFTQPKVLPDGHVVATRMEEVMWKQANVLRGLLDAETTHQAEYIPALGGQAEVVNAVHTTYTQALGPDEDSLSVDASSSMSSDDEEEGGKKHYRRRHVGATFEQLVESEEEEEEDEDGEQDAFLDAFGGVGAADGMNIEEEVHDEEEHDNDDPMKVLFQSDVANVLAAGEARLLAQERRAAKRTQLAELKNNKRPRFSLSFLRRRFIPLGFHKTLVGTAVAVRYSVPWQTAQLVFPADRVYTTGANQRWNDRVLVKHATLPFVYTPVAPNTEGTRPLRVAPVRRFSQNFVLNHRLPTGRSICLGLLASRGVRNRSNDRPDDVPLFFKNIRILMRWKQNHAALLVYPRAVLCAGTKSLKAAQQAYRFKANEIANAYNTPENEATEQAQVRQGVIRPEVAIGVLNYRLDEQGTALVPGGQANK